MSRSIFGSILTTKMEGNPRDPDPHVAPPLLQTFSPFDLKVKWTHRNSLALSGTCIGKGSSPGTTPPPDLYWQRTGKRWEFPAPAATVEASWELAAPAQPLGIPSKQRRERRKSEGKRKKKQERSQQNVIENAPGLSRNSAKIAGK